MLRERYLEQRYRERLKAVIEKKLPAILSSHSVIENPQERIKVRIPVLDEPYFKPAVPGGNHGTGGGSGSGNPGTESANYELEVELSIEELADWLFTYLQLPRLKPKRAGDEHTTSVVRGITRSAPRSRLHRRQTFREYMKRGTLTEYVLRYRDIRTDETPTIRADVYMIRDISGSMDEHKRFKAKSIAFWAVEWLRRNYPFVHLHFAVHDTKASWVNEAEFFTAYSGGGTLVSAGFTLVADHIKQNDTGESNYYVLYFGDGENQTSDNAVVGSIVKQLDQVANLIGYAEIPNVLGTQSEWSTLGQYLSRYAKDNKLQSLRITTVGTVRNAILELFGDVAQ